MRELGRLDAPGRPILLGTTEEFLRCFGVQGLEDLPEMDPVQLEDFKAEAEEEIQLKLDVITNNTDRCRFTGPVGQIRKQKRSDENAHNIRT